MTKDKRFAPAYASELLSIARGDLASAEVLAAHPTQGRKENICFAAQQCIEKTLKAMLCANNKAVPMTHNIELLLDRLGESTQPPLGTALIELTDFATIRRYQEGSEVISSEDIAATIAAARQTLVWAEALMLQVRK